MGTWIGNMHAIFRLVMGLGHHFVQEKSQANNPSEFSFLTFFNNVNLFSIWGRKKICFTAIESPSLLAFHNKLHQQENPFLNPYISERKNEALSRMEPRLFEASRLGDIPGLHSLLAEDPLILERVGLNTVENPLHVSCLAGKTEIAKEIVSLRPEFVRELNGHGFSPLHIASANGHLEIVRELLHSVGNDICLLKGKDGKVSFHCAANRGKVDVLRELVLACPESISQVTVRGETALHLAVKNNQFVAFKVLMEELVRLEMMEIVNWKDKEGNTILHSATMNKQHETIELLIGDVSATGVDLNSINSSGFTPRDVLDFILQSGGESSDYKMVEIFQQAGALKARDLVTSTSRCSHIHQVQSTEANPTSALSHLMNLRRELTKEIESSSMETQSALMVVAVLIATMTYQAILSPPSGFWSAESGKSHISNCIRHRKEIAVGEAIMGTDPEVYAVFTVFNAIGFFASVGMIYLLTSGFPLRAGLRLAILSMTATYVIAMVYEAPTKMKIVFTVVSFMGLIVLVELARFVLWLMRKCGVLPINWKRKRCFIDGNQLGV
ncbi:ankyrin repeat-containing protein BDA1-like [Ziziphus jujuba]|uniref:Ankyrin repeat-containing protein BDA1-like n=1 Tax=Ziziphus jujuba TaxID=326968 RepID=A0ABM4A9F1_ZIZJJ|nr:ankyrin repeat-containing protein BDA1-like [Ziziphus jujuba]